MVMSYRSFILYSVILIISSCSGQGRLEEPLVFHSPAEFYKVLEELKVAMSDEEYKELTNAVGYLKVTDTQHFTIEAFYQSLSGLSVNQIIDKSNSIKSEIANKKKAG